MPGHGEGNVVERDLNIEGLEDGAGDPPRSLTFGGSQLIAVFVGGMLGALARAALAEALKTHPGSWPWATFAVNVAGAFLLGAFVAVLERRPAAPAHARSFLAVGVCGALTTFSTMMLELVRMLDRGEDGLALGYAAASIGAGYVAVAAARRLFAGGPGDPAGADASDPRATPRAGELGEEA
jgi:CrcB protein